ncbi:CRISPR system precrRNA processing endoribonuclease RAMP protein Cas6 [Thermogemmatispora onikobensis]|uniref:CRISPR system precrRNA processing endoribonuclease RAMP protein Cas6 n=1 Tax=Thermogemmatispora onikobensis TaxID=732234 RepID=UPI0008535382|nr:CRISPR system precrRNA processing endoribonuclease RAMP protein Cas6 [Thermogemmatispora onikobensis]
METTALVSPGSFKADLYALHLRLRPLQPGTLMPFSGELVHGAWLEWLRGAAPDVSARLHEGNKRRLFTCSSLQFPLPPAQVREAERNNRHLPLSPEKTYTIRITLLLGELFPHFYKALIQFNHFSGNLRRSPFMQIGRQVFLLEEVIASPDDPARWTGFTTFRELAAQAALLQPARCERMTLEFDSLTTFNWINTRNKVYGNYYALLPLPRYLFPGLAKRWQELVSQEPETRELAVLVQPELIEEYILDDGIVIDDYDLRPHQVHFSTHVQPGFIGRCVYRLRGPDPPPASGSALAAGPALTVRQQLWLLAYLAFYSGVGYKTPMGMGRVRPL